MNPVNPVNPVKVRICSTNCVPPMRQTATDNAFQFERPFFRKETNSNFEAMSDATIDDTD